MSLVPVDGGTEAFWLLAQPGLVSESAARSTSSPESDPAMLSRWMCRYVEKGGKNRNETSKDHSRRSLHLHRCNLKGESDASQERLLRNARKHEASADSSHSPLQIQVAKAILGTWTRRLAALCSVSRVRTSILFG